MTNYNDGKWHGWNGGECPVHPETVVEVMNVNTGLCGPYPANKTYWGCEVTTAFRVIKEYREPREFWIVGGNAYDSIEDAYSDLCQVEEIIHVREVLK